jgi:hypothetical protein
METKKWYLSKRFWGGIVGLVVAALMLVDTTFGTHITTNPIYNYVLTMATALGLYGGVTANSKLTI